MNHKQKCVLMFLLLGSGVAQAQTLVMKDLGNGFQGAASVDLAWVHTDNYFYQPKGTGTVPETSANGYFVRPNMLIDRDFGAASFKVRVAGEYSDFDLPQAFENAYETQNLDGNIAGSLDWRLGTRNRVNLLGEFRHSHDAFGAITALPAPNPATKAETDKWDQTFLSGTWRLGAPEAAFNFDITGSSRDRHYVSNESNTKRLDYRTDDIGGAVYYNYSPKTSFVFDIDHSATNFDETKPGANYDTSAMRYRTGIQWKATAKTTGDVRVGLTQKEFDGSDSESTNFNWLAQITWNPAARTTFNLLTGRTTQESYLVSGTPAGVTAPTAGNPSDALAIDNRDYSLEWAQRWGSRFATYASARFIQSDFLDVDTGPRRTVVTDRSDEVKTLSLTGEYMMVKYFSFLGSVSSADRKSTVPGAGYDSVVTYLGVRIIP